MTDNETAYGFRWGPVEVERMASVPRSGGECRIIGVYTGEGRKRNRRLEIYVSPAGNSIRVWRDGKELK